MDDARDVHPDGGGASIVSAMGFDFRIAAPPERWPDAHRPQYEDAPEYFRVTHKAMHALRAALAVTGVLDVDARLPSFPPWPPPQMSATRAGGVELAKDHGMTIEPPSTATEIETLEQWRRKRAQALETTSNDPQKVPAFKLGSNDGWRLSPDECALLATGLRAAIDERADALHAAIADAGSTMTRDASLAWLSSFAEYLALAAEHGGVVVS